MRLTLISCLCLLLTVFTTTAQTSTKTDQLLTASFDTLLNKEFKSGEPGATAIVVRKGQVIYKKAIGMADMELNVPLQADMIFRIGSITKQFTAVAILQLAEQGKLSLQDDIKKFVPELTFKENITVEHLLNHTSGIVSYTNKADFPSKMRTDMKPMEIIHLTSKDTLEFKPGTKWNYNNTGYIILGYIIEKLSGKTYEEYVQQNLFAPAGMNNSYYGSESKIIKNRAKGYEKEKNTFQNSDYISMTLPYAGGSLLSTVEDLWKWNKALYSYKFIKKEWVDKATTPYVLPNGKSTRYGYGLSINLVQGSKAIEHGGGIPGFLTDAIYLPAEDVFVAVFSNCGCKSPNNVTYKMAALAIGKPLNFKAIPISETDAKAYEAVYVNDEGEERVIRYANGKLTSQRGSGTQFVIEKFEKDRFFFENSVSIIEFTRNQRGAVESLIFKSNTEESTWKKSSKPLPAAVTFITVDASVLAGYVGNYTLAPGFILTITHEGSQLFAQATGQQRLELQAISKTMFQTKGVDAKIEFKQNAEGKTESLVLYQGGREMPAKKE
ncbi:serine hydrolase [Lacibacter sp. H375]|uniref:serine hydrolase n=1 Tax=Lacibacter sp. H375 TaxID=3133424 RepID=UPI0030C3B938